MDRFLHNLSETVADYRPELKLPNFSNLATRAISVLSSPLSGHYRARRDGLPLLLQSPWHPSISGGQAAEVEKVMEALRDFSAELLRFLNYVCRHLDFWRIRSELSDRDKAYFMLLERGPRAFAFGVSRIIRASLWENSAANSVNAVASARITERVAVLTALQCRLASLLGVVHMEVDKLGAELTKGHNVRSAISAPILAISRAMAVLEGSYDLPQNDSSNFENGRATSSISLQFDEMPHQILRKSEWTEKDVDAGIEVLFSNLDLLRFMVNCLMLHHQKPSKFTRYWIRYTATAAVVTLTSAWLIRHSRLMGSDDLDRWIRKSNAAVMSFTRDHVEAPLVAIRDDLFETFKKRQNKAQSVAEAQLTAESLHRMLEDYVKQTTDKVSADLTQDDMMRVMMTSYEEEVVHPLRNLVGGQLARALLIQIQKLKLDTERAMVELNSILRANEINFAILAAVPAVLLAVFIGVLIQAVLNEEDRKAGSGRDAQTKRRMLMGEVEKAILCFQMMVDEGQEEEAAWRFGMVIYSLDMLYRKVEPAARSTKEWSSIRGDILDLATPGLATSYKLAITARMERIYECLVPLPKF